MTRVPSKTNSIVLAVIVNGLCACLASAQSSINCDTFNISDNTTILECSNYFNYFENQIDSFPKLIGYELDETLGIELPIGINEKIWVILEKDHLNSDTVKISYIHDQRVFQSGMLVKGLASGKFTGEFLGEAYSAEFQKGQLNGEYKRTNESGDVYVVNYQEGKLEGPLYEINAAGITTHYCNYKNNLPDGPELRIYDDGRLDYYFYHVNGVLEDGTYRRFDGDGNQILILKVENGKVVYKKED
jgi:antitoxin component YwqK of YwqJK toxin-antitoxin module